MAYQLQLVRLFSIIQWHHFAYMIISLALLGYGASGTFLSLSRHRIAAAVEGAYVLAIAAFAVASVPAFLLAQLLAFNPEELLWRPSMIWRLACLYLALGTPFFFVACAVGLAYMGWGRLASRVYGTDLAGAAAGGALALLLPWWLDPAEGLAVAGTLGIVAAAVAVLETGGGWKWAAVLTAVWVAALASTPPLRIQPSPYKDLSSALQVSGAQIRSVRSSPWGQVTVLANDAVPFREAPGAGLKATAEPPAQLAVFHDGDFVSTVTRDDGDRASLSFLASLPSAAPYSVSTPARVLVLEAGGGLLARQAEYLGAAEVTAVERNPDIVDLVKGEFTVFSGSLYSGDPVSVVRADPRFFLANDRRTWDLIQLPASGGLGSGASGLFALNEDYLRTSEAIGNMLERLAPNGILAIQAWETLPPRASLRLAATAVEALRRRGVAMPGDHIIALRSWQMAVIMVRNGRFDPESLAAVESFADSWGYDLAWYAGMPRQQAVRGMYRTREPWLYDALAAFTAGDRSFARGYKFDIRPTTDDRPFFDNFLRWRTLPETLGLLYSGGMPLLEAGSMLLLATLVQAMLLAVLLILLPLLPGRRHYAALPPGLHHGRTALFFGAIGLGFMLIEVAAIHRFVLFLEEPVFASATVVSAFLVFAGCGGVAAARIAARFGRRRAAGYGAISVAVIGACLLLVLGPITGAATGLGTMARILLAVALIAPLAFAMGQLFPTAMAALDQSTPGIVPWAWAVNGCASVVGAVLATILAMTLGFDGCMAVALGLYVTTLWTFPVPAVAGPG